MAQEVARGETSPRREALWAQLNAEIAACTACPRLVAHRQEVARTRRRAFRDWDYWGRPVPGFGDPQARVAIIGLAPAAHGANRTGRIFTGDSSGQTLMAALYRAGFANQPTSEHRDDGLALRGVFLTAVVRCAPPKNRPTAQELANCRPFLARELALLPSVRVVVALGRVAFDGYLRLLREQGVALPRLAFRHGGCYRFEPPLPTLVASYHPSRQNTQTGRLTEAMLDEVFALVQCSLRS
ncbi:MAG TPA: uracil-DNA glycosylase [Anaerolineae bacterium]|nr:uracil-DNA glycosylase [Anaerolineae bacterium]